MEAEYVRFDCLSWYGDGCGLQYFGVFDVTHHNAGDKHGKIMSRTMSYMKIELINVLRVLEMKFQTAFATGSSSHLRAMLPKSRGRPLPAHWPNNAT